MALKRKRYRWYNTFGPIFGVASAAAGSVASFSLLTETQIEDDNLVGGTIERVVGDIYLSASGTGTEFLMWLGLLPVVPAQQVYTAAALASANLGESSEDPGWTWTRLWGDFGTTPSYQHIPFDVRRKVRIRQGTDTNLWASNLMAVAAGIGDVDLAFWAKVLVSA